MVRNSFYNLCILVEMCHSPDDVFHSGNSWLSENASEIAVDDLGNITHFKGKRISKVDGSIYFSVEK